MTAVFREAAVAAVLSLSAAVNHAEAASSRPAPAVAAANAAARVEPRLDGFLGAMQRFAWSEGGLYQVYTAPGRVTDIVLEPGEQLLGPGPIAAGDTARWVIGDTESGQADARRVHVLVKPTQPGLATNLVINTDRRTYYLELRAGAAAYMASVAWTYPKGALIALAKPVGQATQQPPPSPTPPPAAAADLTRLNFDYRISGDKVGWRPQQVFDDGAKVHLVLPAQIGAGELPPLFLLDAAGRAGLVDYRIAGRQVIVDRLFDRAELRLGDRRSARKVRIERVGGRAP
ncbi:type IV secretion system protein VirB9 [Caulobacter rhizosphaerae]|uniref:Type IV secretion system protein VirB9 n=1 Tax=Caulobacter rhizosphaerae TaxID=2010972 RepID=A0ABU1MWG1_9CAUL|nr:P-type conjugative transfer protein TrbG [Caulobacter rhizosphaerae]MDR6530246.1 type IV secretion system protein VirB9 [Caulobacter rhizosphaerae]